MTQSIKFDPHSISADIRSRLWALIAQKIDVILDDFYKSALNSKHRELLLKTDMPALKAKQKDHWERLFLHQNDKDHDASIRNMHVKHRDVSLEIGDYISTYLFLLTQFHQLILLESPGPKQAYEYIVAVNTIIGADIDRALETYDDVFLI